MIDRPSDVLKTLPSFYSGQWYTFENPKNPTYETIIVLREGITKPTLEEMENKLIELQAQYDNAVNNKASAKQKLQDLGLTVDEIKEAFGI